MICLQGDLMPSLLSLSKLAKYSSLGSVTTQNLPDDPAILPPMHEEEDLLSQLLLPDGKGGGQEGRARTQGQAARSPRGALGSERGLHLDPQGGEHAAVASSKGTKEDEKEEGDQYTEGLFLKQLQQQRQHKHDSYGQDPRVGGSTPPRSPRVGGSTPPRSPRVRGSTPPRSPRIKPDQARAKQPAGDHRTYRDPCTAHDPRAVSNSPKPELLGWADQKSPERHFDAGTIRASSFLSDLQQSIEPAVKAKDSR